MYRNQLHVQSFTVIIFLIHHVFCTVDMNMSEFQYLSNHLQDHECRRLVAALHYKSPNSPNALDQAEKRVSKEVPCLQQLLHWNKESNAGKAETHQLVSRRLTQIGREDLAKWLSTTAYDGLGEDLKRQLRHPFEQYEPIYLRDINLTAINNDTAMHPHKRFVQQTVPTPTPVEAKSQAPDPLDTVMDPTEWTIFDTISWTIVIVLLLIIIILVVYLTLASPCCLRKKRRNKSKRYERLDDDDSTSSSPRYRSLNSPVTDMNLKQNLSSIREYSDCPVRDDVRHQRYTRQSRHDRPVYNTSENLFPRVDQPNFDPLESESHLPDRSSLELLENQHRHIRSDHDSNRHTRSDRISYDSGQNRPMRTYEMFTNRAPRLNKFEQPERLHQNNRHSSKSPQNAFERNTRLLHYQGPEDSILPTTVPVFPQPPIHFSPKSHVNPYNTKHG